MGGWSLLPRVSDRKTGRIIRSCFAELFGTFSIVFWGAGAAFNKEMTTLHLAFGFGIGEIYIFPVYFMGQTKHHKAFLTLHNLNSRKIGNLYNT